MSSADLIRQGYEEARGKRELPPRRRSHPTVDLQTLLHYNQMANYGLISRRDALARMPVHGKSELVAKTVEAAMREKGPYAVNVIGARD